jgi:hypothetical protein
MLAEHRGQRRRAPCAHRDSWARIAGGGAGEGGVAPWLVLPHGGCLLGRRYISNFDDGTGYRMFDFSAVMDNGQPVERYRVNVCEYVSWTIR